jgi:pyruvate formate lyase activating enzyme
VEQGEAGRIRHAKSIQFLTMRIGGFQKVSLIDYPGQISAVVYTQGCNFRCPYCHNPDLVNPLLYKAIEAPESILSFLDMRRGKLDAVTLTGGEPTLQGDLRAFARDVRKMGYLVKLDTNGTLPETLKDLIETGEIDYVAMDIKAPLEKYSIVTRAPVEPGKIRKSIDIIMSSNIEYEFRTTIVPSLITQIDLQAIAQDIRNARCYVLQRFVSTNLLDTAFVGQKTFTPDEMKDMKGDLEKYLPRVMIRC